MPAPDSSARGGFTLLELVIALTILEPVVILGMGLLVGFIAFSMFLAIFRLNEVPF